MSTKLSLLSPSQHSFLMTSKRFQLKITKCSFGINFAPYFFSPTCQFLMLSFSSFTTPSFFHFRLKSTFPTNPFHAPNCWYPPNCLHAFRHLVLFSLFSVLYINFLLYYLWLLAVNQADDQSVFSVHYALCYRLAWMTPSDFYISLHMVNLRQCSCC